MKLLDGTELAGYVKERQAKQVRNLRQSHGVAPKLAIIQTVNNPVIDTYVRMKQQYGEDVQIDVEIYRPNASELTDLITTLNADRHVHGIIIQLPLIENLNIDEILNLVEVNKDVDGLAVGSVFTAATAQAIDWLLNGYNIDIKSKKIAIVGNGRLVGAPLAKLWGAAGHAVTIFDEDSKNVEKNLRKYSIVVTATGVPNLITSASIQPGAVVVDAATSAEHGKIVGDVAPDVRQRGDITITPEKGGVGPLTVASLFENVLTAARRVAGSK